MKPVTEAVYLRWRGRLRLILQLAFLVWLIVFFLAPSLWWLLATLLYGLFLAASFGYARVLGNRYAKYMIGRDEIPKPLPGLCLMKWIF